MYEWQVKAKCNGADDSAYTAAQSFDTLENGVTPTCGTPTYLNTTDITESNARVSWSSSDLDGTYTVRYKSSGDQWITVNDIYNTFYIIDELVPNVNYVWQVKLTVRISIAKVSVNEIGFSTTNNVSEPTANSRATARSKSQHWSCVI